MSTTAVNGIHHVTSYERLRCFKILKANFFLDSVEYYKTFDIYFSVDGNWGEWSKWSTCTKTCKQGKQSRKRKCNSPAAQYGGKKCDGQPSETQACNQNVQCPGEPILLN